jgi:serine O-acetyltransferase
LAVSKSALAADLGRAYRYADGGRARRIGVCLRSPGVHAVTVYRLGRWLLERPRWLRLLLDPFYLVLDLAVHAVWGIEISRRARIGEGLYIAHAGGLVVAAGTVMGTNCNLSHDVTIGLSGRGENGGVPVIGDDVYIAPGAKLFGKIRIGDNVKIGANAVIHRDVPSNAIAVLDPGFQIVSFKGNRRGAALHKAS